jgi:uncharacterized protein (TIGR02466 family)
MEILQLFPIPVLKTKIPVKFSNLIPIIDAQPTSSDKELNSIYGERSLNSYILDLPELKDLKNYILNLVELYSESNLHYKPDTPYKITQSWVTIKNPGQSHTLHSHPNSIISGVFYYGNISPETPSIYFNNSSSSYRTPIITHPYEHESIENLVNTTSVHTIPGTLLLFPSWLKHGVPENKSNLPRKSLAFNSVPQNGFGDETTLTELKF